MSTLADIIGNDEEFTQKDLNYWLEANKGYYNSLFTTDNKGYVQLMSPKILTNNANGVQPGTKINSDLMKRALENKTPFISEPYLAQTGNLVILISYPIFNDSDVYQGVVDGTLYLETDNSLGRILTTHEHLDESSTFVVDSNGRIIYHPDASRINENIAEHELIQDVLEGNYGSAKITNHKGEEYLSGYAFINETNWGIISQTPTSVIQVPLHTLVQKIALQSLPLLIIIISFAWLVAFRISNPINKLAKFSKKAITEKTTPALVDQINIHSNLYEVRQLYLHFRKHFQVLNSRIYRDGLSGLFNRLAFDYQIVTYFNQKIPHSLILIDIDRFKRVNDQYGHPTGDEVIKFLANTMQEVTRSTDQCFRYGGEEFAIILKDDDENDAYNLAERLRTTIAETNSPTGKPITISIGISSSNIKDEDFEAIIDRADTALYQSKNEGRNRTTINNE